MLFDTVKILCQSINITVAQLEREVKVGNGSIRKWRKVSPSVESLVKVADFFGISTDELLGRDAQISIQSHVLAKNVDKLSPAKQELVKQYINMIQAS